MSRYRINPGELRHRITFQLQDLDSEDEDWRAEKGGKVRL